MNNQMTFNEVCVEIEILRLREQDLERMAEIAQKQCFNSRVDRNTYLPLDVALYNYDAAMDRLNEIRGEIERKEGVKKAMEKLLEGLEGLAYKVAFLRDVERLPLYEIAKREGYSYDYVRKISQKAPRLKMAQ